MFIFLYRADKVDIIIRIEKERLHRLNMDGKVQVLSIQSVTKQKINRNAAAIDSQNNSLNVGDMSRQGQIKHVYRHFVFIFCHTLTENGGIFVRKARNLLLAGEQNYSCNSFGVVSLARNVGAATELTNFEKGAENAFAIVYPQSQMLGCFFHFKQNIWRNVSELDLKKEFLENNISRRTMKNLAALAFVPEQDVIRTVTKIKESANEILDGKNLYLYAYFHYLKR
ncbi:unnamed protein product [Rotaria sp. Silwood1]|nr:unnamed protein product [Rotaria sp. Silwood1]